MRILKQILFILFLLFVWVMPIKAELTGPWVRLPPLPSVKEQLKSWPKNQNANMIEYIFKDVAVELKKIDWNNEKQAKAAPKAVGAYIVKKYHWPKENYYANIYGFADPFRVSYFLLQLKDKDGEVWELKYWIVEPY